MLEANETAPSPSFITLDGNSVKNFLNSGGLESESDFSPGRPWSRFLAYSGRSSRRESRETEENLFSLIFRFLSFRGFHSWQSCRRLLETPKRGCILHIGSSSLPLLFWDLNIQGTILPEGSIPERFSCNSSWSFTSPHERILCFTHCSPLIESISINRFDVLNGPLRFKMGLR